MSESENEYDTSEEVERVIKEVKEEVDECELIRRENYNDHLSERRRLWILYLKTKEELRKIEEDRNKNEEDLINCSYNYHIDRYKKRVDTDTKKVDVESSLFDIDVDHAVLTMYDLIKERDREIDVLVACYEMNVEESNKLLIEIKQKERVRNHIQNQTGRRILDIRCEKWRKLNEHYKTHPSNNVILR
jgi:hypothetical protein